MAIRRRDLLALTDDHSYPYLGVYGATSGSTITTRPAARKK